MSTDKPVIVVCASSSTYDKVIPFSSEIEKLGLNVVLPDMAEAIKRDGTQNKEAVIDWATNEHGYGYKAQLMRDHFEKIENGDAILVMNYEKNGNLNYIGGNVLMEMTVAFYLHKPIYILFDAPKNSPLLDEILGMQPTILDSDIQVLRELQI